MITLENNLIGLLSGTLPANPNWAQIFKDARKQTLLGVTYDIVEGLPVEQQPPREVLMPWVAVQSRIIANNKLTDQRAAEATAILSSMGFRSCVLKGQGVARLYPKPELRQSGDVDIWVEGDRWQVLAALKARFEVGDTVYHHTDVKFFPDVEVEVHYHPSWLCNPFLNRKLQRFFDGKMDEQMSHRCPYKYRSDGDSGSSAGAGAVDMGFNCPTVEFDAVYSLVHIYRHLFDEGVGLRQVMDYFYIIKALLAEERSGVMDVLRSLRMRRFAAGMMYVLQQVFGLSESEFLCPSDKKTGEFILNEMLLSGNFGHYDVRNKHAADEGLVKRAFRKTGRQLKFVRYFPQEVLWAPLWRVWHYFWRKRHN